jgi:hypothetical protein
VPVISIKAYVMAKAGLPLRKRGTEGGFLLSFGRYSIIFTTPDKFDSWWMGHTLTSVLSLEGEADRREETYPGKSGKIRNPEPITYYLELKTYNLFVPGRPLKKKIFPKRISNRLKNPGGSLLKLSLFPETLQSK